MSRLGFFSDPHVQFVSQVIEEVLSGNLQIPRFQRPYVWDWERRLNLLRSIHMGIPMGAIMIWRTSGESLKTFDKIGTVRVKSPQLNGPRQYLLDGVQRLSTLVSALTAPESSVDSLDSNTPYLVEEEDRRAYFDLEANDFVSIKLSQVLPKHMPLHVIGRTVDLIRFQRNLSGPDLENWLAASDTLARAFREYKIPVIPIVTDDVEMASQTFQRINSAGQQMSEMHMLHALTFSGTFDLNKELENFRESLEGIGWSDIEDELLLRILKASLSLDIYKSSVEHLSKAIKKNFNVFADLRTAVVDAADFFSTQMSMPSPEFVPYAVQLICVVEAYRVAATVGTQVLVHELKEWVWLTTYLEYFTGLSGDKVAAQLNFVRNCIREGVFDVKKAGLPVLEVELQKVRFDYRSARSRAWMVMLANLHDSSNFGTGTDLIRKYGRSAIVPGIPHNLFENPQLYYSPGNRFLVPPAEIDSFRDKLLLAPDEDFLALHGIKRSAAVLSRKQFDEFVVLRQDELTELEYKRVSKFI